MIHYYSRTHYRESSAALSPVQYGKGGYLMICLGCNRDLGPAKTKKERDALRLGTKILCELCARRLIEANEATP